MASSVRLGKRLEPRRPREAKVATELEVREAGEDQERRLPSPGLESETVSVSSVTSDHGPVLQSANLVGFAPAEERTDRKARDPIAQPAAAVTKKHSDTEKVELPAFLNFPSEQGIVMEQDQLEESGLTQRSPSSKVIAELLHEETSEEKSPVIENQTMTRTNKTVKTVLKKKKSKPRIEESPLREIPILVERTKADDSVEPETVPEPEVDLLFFLVLFLSKF